MKKRLIREMFCLLLTASLAAGCSRGGNFPIRRNGFRDKRI